MKLKNQIPMRQWSALVTALAVASSLAAEASSPVISPQNETPKSELERSLLASAATGQSGSEKRADLAKWDDAANHRSPAGPGGTAWDSHYRSFIQTDENAVAKGFPTHAEAARAILADATKAPQNLFQHLGWVLFIKHFSQTYRPESATADLKRLYEDLEDLKFGGVALRGALPFKGDAKGQRAGCHASGARSRKGSGRGHCCHCQFPARTTRQPYPYPMTHHLNATATDASRRPGFEEQRA